MTPNPFEQIPELGRDSARILLWLAGIAIGVGVIAVIVMALSGPAQAAPSFEDEAAEICKDGCVLMSKSDYETLRAVAARRCKSEIRL